MTGKTVSPKAKRDDWANLLVYAHNLSSFDGIFILEGIIKNFNSKNINILWDKDKKFISIKVSFVVNIIDETTKKRSKKTLNITFLDSVRLLPRSLKVLSKAFSLNNSNLVKGYFDHNLVKSHNLNNYNIRKNSTAYCLLDCKSLHNVLEVFNNLVFKNWESFIWNSPTISSLAFSIFRSNFLDEKIIPQISGTLFKIFKNGYSGGAVDLYIPFHFYDDDKKLLFYYDVNSLYPFVMKMFEYPCGEVMYFENDITKIKPYALAFCFCEVKAPENLEHPFLQVHVNNKTISPLGEFEGVFYSKEILHARKLGYDIKVINGYYFTEKKKLFSKYVEIFHDTRKLYDKDNPMNYICKLLLNSLYGRLAMCDLHNQIKVLDENKFKEFMSKIPVDTKVEDVIQFDDSKKFIVETKLERFSNDYNSNFENHVTSIPIAAAITAEARIFMSQFKNNPKIQLSYSDTDSIITTCSPEEMNNIFPGIIHKDELGKLKHEYTISNAVMLGPKCYLLELVDGSRIVKVKGVKTEFIEKAIDENQLNFNMFVNILRKDASLTINQDKWYRNHSQSTIEILKTTYEIKQNNNKRELIYEDDLCVATKPLVFEKEWFKAQISKKFI